MAECNFKPSNVHLSAIPFGNTFKRAEYEQAAALLVRTCVLNGDTWAAHGPKAIGAAMKADVDADVSPIRHLARNPFFRPDFRGLVKEGFAEYADDSEHAPVRFTALGFERMTKWVRSDTQEAPRG